MIQRNGCVIYKWMYKIVRTYPDASGGNRVTTLPFSAPGNSINLPTSA